MHTEETLEHLSQGKRKKKRKAGQPYKVAEEDMKLCYRQVFFYGFQLTAEDRISKATTKKIQRQLARETASQMQQ